MTYDGARGEVVLFGGRSHDFLGDTWAWDGAAWNVPLRAHLHLSPSSGPPGTVLEVKGTGFAGFEWITIRFIDSITGKTRLRRLKTDGTGLFIIQVTVPVDASAGVQRITTSGWRSGQHTSAKFTVT